MSSWLMDRQTLEAVLTCLTVVASGLGAFLLWIGSSGLKALTGWLASQEETAKTDAINSIKKGLTATHPDANASECVDELVAGLDQWQLARQRTKNRTTGLRRTVGASASFLVFLGGAWACSKLGTALSTTTLEQAFVVLCLLSLLALVFYGYPLVRLVMDTGIPTKETLSGKNQGVSQSTTVSAGEAAVKKGAISGAAKTSAAIEAPATIALSTNSAAVPLKENNQFSQISPIGAEKASVPGGPRKQRRSRP